MIKRIKTGIFIALMALPALANAQTQSFNYLFDISLGMAKIGEMRVSADISGNSYATVGTLKSTGLAGAIYDVSYESRAQGTITHPWLFVPSRFNSVSKENGDQKTTQINYAGNRVTNVTFVPPRAGGANATAQTDTIDPMTLIYFLVRPVPEANVCGGTFNMFDGHTAMRVQYSNPRRFNNGNVSCSVTYSGSNSGVALSSVTFAPAGNGMMIIKAFEADTNAGALTARRR